MTPRPARLVYNDLNGEEIKHVAAAEFEKLLNDIPYLQRHLTMPRVAITVTVQFRAYAEQASAGPTDTSSRTLNLEVENGVPSDSAVELSQDVASTVDSSPRGDPPDKIREDFGLAVPRTTPVTDATGRRLGMADRPTVDGRVIEDQESGIIFDRTGNNAGMRGGTFVTIDSGKADLENGNFNRSKFDFGRNSHAGTAGRPESHLNRNVVKNLKDFEPGERGFKE